MKNINLKRAEDRYPKGTLFMVSGHVKIVSTGKFTSHEQKDRAEHKDCIWMLDTNGERRGMVYNAVTSEWAIIIQNN